METVIIEEVDAGQRLDKCLSMHLNGFSRSRIQQLIALGCIKSSGATITDSSRKVKQGEIYEITLPKVVESRLVAVPLELEIIFEDSHLLVINKPAGMTVHPAPGHAEDTLVNALLAHCGDSLSGIGGVMRPGIVHRIDKDTSGLLVVAKHDTAHRHLSEQLAERTLKRQYLAVVKGIPKPASGRIEGNIARSPVNRKKMAVVKSGGKTALTHYKTEEVFKDAALLRCVLETGRTHQIRVHLSHIGYPIVGDLVYGRKSKSLGAKRPHPNPLPRTGEGSCERSSQRVREFFISDFPRQALHAEKLTLIHPITEKLMEFSAPLPEDMVGLLKELRNAS